MSVLIACLVEKRTETLWAPLRAGRPNNLYRQCPGRGKGVWLKRREGRRAGGRRRRGEDGGGGRNMGPAWGRQVFLAVAAAPQTPPGAYLVSGMTVFLTLTIHGNISSSIFRVEAREAVAKDDLPIV